VAVWLSSLRCRLCTDVCRLTGWLLAANIGADGTRGPSKLHYSLFAGRQRRPPAATAAAAAAAAATAAAAAAAAAGLAARMRALLRPFPRLGACLPACLPHTGACVRCSGESPRQAASRRALHLRRATHPRALAALRRQGGVHRVRPGCAPHSRPAPTFLSLVTDAFR
jgi:hypothetical protein